MSKRQAVSVAEIAELEALGITPETPAEPKPKLITESLPTGWGREEKYCEAHGLVYDTFSPPRSGISVGRCKECEADKRLDEEARAALEQRRDEVRAKVHELAPLHEDAVKAQVDAELESYLAGHAVDARQFLEGEVRDRLHTQLVEQ